MSLREAAQQALAYIEEVDYGPYDRQPVINALRAALAEPQTTHWEGCEEVHPECRTAPAPRKPLTDEQIMSIDVLRYHFALNGGAGPISKKGKEIIEAIERAHGIGGGE